MSKEKKQNVKKRREAAKQKDATARLVDQYLNRTTTQATPDMRPYLDACPSPALRRRFRDEVASGLLLTLLFRRRNPR